MKLSVLSCTNMKKKRKQCINFINLEDINDVTDFYNEIFNPETTDEE